MEKLMQPYRLDLDPGSTSAAREWRHWLKTFENYIEIIIAALPEEQRNIDKLKVLINFVAPQVYDYIKESETYNKAIQVLKALYEKTPNQIFARHLLATAKQEVGQSLDDFLLTLTKLSKDCNFADVTGEDWKLSCTYWITIYAISEKFNFGCCEQCEWTVLFSGIAYHNKTLRPAKSATRYKNNKKGHFFKVSKSVLKDNDNASIVSTI